MDAFERLEQNSTGFFDAIDPQRLSNPMNCPETADAVHDSLRTGRPRPLRGDLNSRFQFGRRTRWHPAASVAALRQRVRGHGSQIVVRRSCGDRRDPDRLTNTHYFNIVNIHGRIYVVDAQTRDFTQDFSEYLGRERYDNLDYASGYDIVIRQEAAEVDISSLGD